MLNRTNPPSTSLMQHTLSAKDLALRYFTKYNPSSKECNKMVCLLCNPFWSHDQTEPVKTLQFSIKGYTWSTQHLDGKHKQQYKNCDTTNQTMLVSDDALNIYNWLEWILAENHELSFCEKHCVCQYAKELLQPISVNILKECMFASVKVLEVFLSKHLLAKFGVVFDGWSDHNVHYLAVFAVGPHVPNSDCILLGFSPFENKGDLSAQEHANYLESLLEFYNCTFSDLLYLVGDNCSTNIKFAEIINVPFLGCNSHCFSLAVSTYLGTFHKDEDVAQAKCTSVQLMNQHLLQQLSALMSKLKTIKGKAKLAEYTDFVALKANETRWNGYYRMTKRYLEFKNQLQVLATEDTETSWDIAMLLLSPVEVAHLIQLSNYLTKFHSVSLLPQKTDGKLTWADVCSLFDDVIADFGSDFATYLAPDAAIVKHPNFESAIVKQLLQELLQQHEADAIKHLKAEKVGRNESSKYNNSNSATATDYASVILQQSQKQQKAVAMYIDLSAIPVSSNTVECFFSQVKLNLMNMRNQLLPRTLEAMMYLKLNKQIFMSITLQTGMALLQNQSIKTS